MKEKHETDDTLPIALDGPIAAPDHHKILFENDRVRVVDFRVGPGETVPLHTHRWPTVNYVISLSDFVSADSDGNVKLDSHNGKASLSEGSVFFQPAFPSLHSVENIGDGELRGVSVELKD